MTDFDPHARLIFVDNDYRASTSAGSLDVINPASLKTEDVLPGTTQECSFQF